MKKIYIILMLCMVLTIKGISQVLLQESFEGTFPPTGWTLVNNGTGNAWKQNTTATYAYAGTKSMQLQYNSANAADAWAFTPALSLTTSSVLVTFYARARSASFPESMKLTVGTGNTVADQTTVLIDSSSITNIVFHKWSTIYTAPTAGNYYFAFNCYSAADEFYLYVDSITIQTIPSCTGAPVGGTAVASAGNVCSGTDFSVSVNGSTSGTGGLTYQWQSSTDSTTWTDIAGEVNTSVIITGGITTPTYYRRKITCGGTDAFSTKALVGLNSVVSCTVCSPNNGTTLHGGTTPSIDEVDIPGTILTNAAVGEPTSGYTLFNDPAITPSLSQGVTYTLNTTFSGAAIASVWFDWNGDGTFDATEWTQITTTAANGSISFTVPATAVLGNTVMRIRTRSSGSANGATDACTEFFSGETEDYIINIVAGKSCSGMPVAGTTVSSVTSICPGTPFNLTVTGATSGTVGLTYQWQSSTDNGITANDIAGADSVNHYEDQGIAALTCYRRSIACGTDTAYTKWVCVNVNPANLCTCSPDNGTILHGGTTPSIDEVDIPGTKLTNAAVGEPANGYTMFSDTTIVPTLAQGVNYTLNTTFSGAAIASVWFDWNQDGQFDATEWFQITTTAANGSISFTVPTTSTLGNTIMRIRTRSTGSPNGSTDACTEFFSGETEDYVINIIAGTPCTGMPVAGTTVSAVTSICPGIPFNLTNTGATSGVTGITYQWQISTDGGVTASDIAGADSLNHYEDQGIAGLTCYRRSITCGVDTAYTKWVCVNVNPVNLCTCSPDNGTILHGGTTPSIDEVDIPGTKLTNAAVGEPASGYTLFSDTTIIPNLAQGITYTLNTTYSGAAIASVWFDWNQDGQFDPSEWFQLTTTAANGSISFTIPITATLGNTIMRIRTRSTGSPNGSTDACTEFFSGETEDYIINVVPGTPCAGIPLAGAIVPTSTSICPGIPFNLVDTGATAGVIGLSYQWQSSVDGGATYTNIAGGDSMNHTEDQGITILTCYRRSIACSTDTVYTKWVCITLNAANLCACSPDNGTTLHTATMPSIDEVDILGTNLGNNAAGAPVSGYTLFSDTALIPNLAKGSSYDLYTVFSTNSIASVWFDWNQDGQFDASEWIQICTDAVDGTTTFTVDTAALLGNTIMRIRTNTTTDTNGDVDACTTFNAGETEDYVIRIVAGLPVTMIQFNGEKKDNVNVLTWITTKETNNKGFEVLRSFNGIDFTTIGYVASSSINGNSAGELNYKFIDNHAPSGNCYYRLRQVDINGKKTYSNIVLIKGIKENKIAFTTIYPNPAKTLLSVALSAPTTQNIIIVITDISGRTIKEQKLFANSGDNQYNINVSDLNAGTYIIKATCNSGCETAVQKFVKQ